VSTGNALLEAKTCKGYTPMDLANTEEMKQILSRENADISFSQGLIYSRTVYFSLF
jgi:hypothetical protein